MTKKRELISRNVLVAVSTMGLTGWQKRNGVFRYIGEGRPWNIRLASTTAELKLYCDSEAQIDGMIVSMPDIATPDSVTRQLSGSFTVTSPSMTPDNTKSVPA